MPVCIYGDAGASMEKQNERVLRSSLGLLRCGVVGNDAVADVKCRTAAHFLMDILSRFCLPFQPTDILVPWGLCFENLPFYAYFAA